MTIYEELTSFEHLHQVFPGFSVCPDHRRLKAARGYEFRADHFLKGNAQKEQGA
jgi:hypothetical protein